MKAADLVSINCGGTIFQTTKSTISRCEMLTSQYNSITEDEVLFLDKDPKVFCYALEIMRGDLSFDEAPNRIKGRLYALLDFLLMRNAIKDLMFFRVEANCPRLKKQSRTLKINRYGNNISIFNIRVGRGEILEKIKLVLEHHDRICSIKIDLFVVDFLDPFFSEEYNEVKQIYTLDLDLEFLSDCNNVILQYRTKMKNQSMNYVHSYQDKITTYN